MTTLATALEAVRDRIEAQTSLSRSRVVDSLVGIPDHLQPLSFAAWPASTRNTRDLRAQSGTAGFDDEITIEIANRLTVDEIGAFDTAMTTARSVRIAVTNGAWWKGAGIECVEYLSERRQRRGGWVIIAQVYRLRRRDSLG